MRTRWAEQYSSSVGQLMAQQSMPTAKATSGCVCVEQYKSAPTRDGYDARSLPSMERRWVRASTKRAYKESLPSCVYNVNKSST
eukprot:932032-Pleurochrysis_carterae.AAC.2